VRSLPTVS